MAPGGLGGAWVRAMLAAGMIATLMWTHAIAAGIELNADYCAVTTSGSDEVDGFMQSYSMESDSPFQRGGEVGYCPSRAESQLGSETFKSVQSSSLRVLFSLF